MNAAHEFLTSAAIVDPLTQPLGSLQAMPAPLKQFPVVGQVKGPGAGIHPGRTAMALSVHASKLKRLKCS
jgi:hypothetical protein